MLVKGYLPYSDSCGVVVSVPVAVCHGSFDVARLGYSEVTCHKTIPVGDVVAVFGVCHRSFDMAIC